MYTIEFDEDAFLDISTQIDYYEKQVVGLGRRFYDETIDLIDMIGLNPNLFSERFFGTRTAVYKTFPFLLHYLVVKDKVIILSVMASSMALRKHRRTLTGRKKRN